jgi:superfamily II DNA or RNA helicase
MVTVSTVRELIKGGWLAPVKTFTPRVLADLSAVRIERGEYVSDDAGALLTQPQFVGDAVAAFRQYCGQGPALAYAVNRAHARILTEHFCAAGLRAREVDGDTPADLRKAAVAALASGEIEILVNVALFCEGLDVPALRAVFILRPTLSEALFLQMAGGRCGLLPARPTASSLITAGIACVTAYRNGIANGRSTIAFAIAKSRRRQSGAVGNAG